jgi:hypothetical protein
MFPARSAARLKSLAAITVLTGALAFGLSACGTVIGQVRTTQLSLFCIVHGGETEATVYQLVGQPSAAGTSASMPTRVKHWGFALPVTRGTSWAAWIGPGSSYVAVFRDDKVAQLDLRRGGHSYQDWSC